MIYAALLPGDVSTTLYCAATPELYPLKIGPHDLAVFSPPYPNSFDYTDVYNVELWAMGYLRNSDAKHPIAARDAAKPCPDPARLRQPRGPQSNTRNHNRCACAKSAASYGIATSPK